ncbi:MAG TPA: cysteine desulfurase-like protein [Actinomycetota bacterium]|nr:cysteine desulfurase-like protein [Actinomycetota bacterium]
MAAPDLSTVRSRFPALAREIGGRPCVFADAPGGSQVPETVIEAMAGYLRRSNANLGGAFVTSQESDALVAEARRAVGAFTGAHPDEIVFGPNATTLLFALARSVARELGPDDEVLVTTLDHDANIAPWVTAARDTGATVRTVDVREEDATLDPDSFEGALSERTKVAAFTLASNAVGSVTPAADLVRLVRERAPGALLVLDGVHLAQHRALDLHGLGADLIACSAYKFFGPHLGVLAVRRELLGRLVPYKVRAADDTVPDRWETGTKNHEGLAGTVAAIGYVASIGEGFGDPAGPSPRERVVAGMEAIRAYEATLSERFLAGTRRIPELTVWGIREPERSGERTPTFAVRVGDRHPSETAKTLAERGIFVWDGHYYALALMERLGLQETGGAVRIGFCHYHSLAEVDRVLEELAALA